MEVRDLLGEERGELFQTPGPLVPHRVCLRCQPARENETKRPMQLVDPSDSPMFFFSRIPQFPARSPELVCAYLDITPPTDTGNRQVKCSRKQKAGWLSHLTPILKESSLVIIFVRRCRCILSACAPSFQLYVSASSPGDVSTSLAGKLKLPRHFYLGAPSPGPLGPVAHPVS
jgi:hypothetical protein